MPAFILGLVLIAAISVGANFTLNEMGFSEADVSKNPSTVRLGDAASPGE